jgi:hypothetical protein
MIEQDGAVEGSLTAGGGSAGRIGCPGGAYVYRFFSYLFLFDVSIYTCFPLLLASH